MLHVDIYKLHDNIIILCVDTIYLRYMGHKYATIETSGERRRTQLRGPTEIVITDKTHEPKIAIIKLEISNK